MGPNEENIGENANRISDCERGQPIHRQGDGNAMRVRRSLARQLAAAGMSVGLLVATPASAETTTDLTITTYNIAAIPCVGRGVLKFCYPDWYGRTVAKRLKALDRFLRAEAARDDGSDLVILQEAFTSEADQIDDGPIEAEIRSGIYPYVATGASSLLDNDIGSFADLDRRNSVKSLPRGTLSSGLVVMSRLPILETRTILFGRDCALDDCNANKGVLFVRLRLPDGNTAAVYVTHMQANPAEESVRLRQVKTFGTLIDLTAADSPYRFLVGDFNFRVTPTSASSQSFTRMTGATHAGRSCLSDNRCTLIPVDAKSLAKARGRGVDHHFFSIHAYGFAIESIGVRYGDVMVGGRTLSDHQYLKVQYRLVSP